MKNSMPKSPAAKLAEYRAKEEAKSAAANHARALDLTAAATARAQADKFIQAAAHLKEEAQHLVDRHRATDTPNDGYTGFQMPDGTSAFVRPLDINDLPEDMPEALKQLLHSIHDAAEAQRKTTQAAPYQFGALGAIGAGIGRQPLAADPFSQHGLPITLMDVLRRLELLEGAKAAPLQPASELKTKCTAPKVTRYNAYKHGTLWDPSDDRTLLHMFANGAGLVDIGTNLGRTPFAIFARLLNSHGGKLNEDNVYGLWADVVKAGYQP